MPNSGWTRRTVLLHLARAGVLLAQDNAPPPIPIPKQAHPRLILSDSELPRLQALLRESAQARKLLAELRREGEKLLNAAPPLPTRMQGETRRGLERVYLFGLLYRLEHEKAYLAPVVRELTALAESREWASVHLIENAEMMQTLAIGFDWFWPELKPAERDLLRQAIVTKGLQPALAAYQSQSGRVTSAGSINMSVNACLGMAALAVADEEPELSAAILKYAVDSISRSFTASGPDGNWSDAPGGWSAAALHVVRFLASLDSVPGPTYDPAPLRGLERAARYRVYSMGPLGRSFGPGPEASGGAPEMFWISRRLHQPAFAWSEQRELARQSHPDALDLVWYGRDAAPPQGPVWPLDALFPAQQRAFFRGAWDDPEAIFLGVKAGDNKTSHGRADLGSFMLDALGVRWAIEAERGIPPNTIAINAEPQEAAAEAHIVSHEFTPGLAWVALDLTRAYAAKAKSWQRRIGLAQREAVLIEDRVRATEPLEVVWSMLTDAEIAFGGQSALLNKGSALLAAEILTPRHAVFDVVPAGANKRRLVASIGEKKADVDLNILLMPYKAGQPRPKITARFPE